MHALAYSSLTWPLLPTFPKEFHLSALATSHQEEGVYLQLWLAMQIALRFDRWKTR